MIDYVIGCVHLIPAFRSIIGYSLKSNNTVCENRTLVVEEYPRDSLTAALLGRNVFTCEFYSNSVEHSREQPVRLAVISEFRGIVEQPGCI